MAKKAWCDLEVPWVDCMGFSKEKKMLKGKQHAADLEHWVARAIVLFPKAHVTECSKAQGIASLVNLLKASGLYFRSRLALLSALGWTA